MPRPRSPDRDRAYQLWLESGKKKLLKDIAAELGVSEVQVRKWKNQDKWDKGTLPKGKSNVTKSKPNKKTIAAVVEQAVETSDLDERQQLFCMLVANGNSNVSAYQKAYGCTYYAAATSATRLLKNDKIKAEVNRLKKERLEAQLLDEHDIFQWHLDIAQADITDFVTFGREEVPVMGAFGPVVDKKTKQPVMKMVNYVKFKDSSEVNGRLIKKVKLGKDGASIELYDAVAAMDWLAEHMSMGTDSQQTLAQELISAYQKGQEGRKKDGGTSVMHSCFMHRSLFILLRI